MALNFYPHFRIIRKIKAQVFAFDGKFPVRMILHLIFFSSISFNPKVEDADLTPNMFLYLNSLTFIPSDIHYSQKPDFLE